MQKMNTFSDKGRTVAEEGDVPSDMNWSPEEGRAVVVNVRNQNALLADIEAHLSRGQGFSVATLNLDHAVKLKHDPLFLAAYAAHSHVTADGNPVVWLLHLAGRRDIRLVSGADSVVPVVALAARLGCPIGFLGSVDASLTAAARQLKADHPGLEVAFIQAPAMGFDPDGAEADAAIAAIGESGTRIVFLALGAPKQERFAARAQKQLPQVGFLSVGAGIDFISGFQRRAPTWVRAIKAEWIWRMMQSPGRLAKRYGDCFAALPELTAVALAHRRDRATIETGSRRRE